MAVPLLPIVAVLELYLYALNALILLLGVFMILLILIQRGKGGGLAGALGGAAGSSAFGTRAGDQFTKITVYVALVWILLIMLTIKLSAGKANSAPRGNAPASPDEQSRLYHPHELPSAAHGSTTNS